VSSNHDKLLFADEKTQHRDNKLHRPWKILIVDDEQDVHDVTELALGRFTFDHRPLMYLHAYSAKEAREILSSNDDIAVVLLDVVMETDSAGLELVKHIRNHLQNSLVRIILRTGQPGYAPEREIITDYDINDYKEKTELTAQKLFTTMVASLRSYKSEHALIDEKEKIRVMLQSITDAVISTDTVGRVSYINSAAEFMTGWSNEEAHGVILDELFILHDPVTNKPLTNPAVTALKKADIYEMHNQMLLERRDGEMRIVTGSVAPIRNSKKTITGTVIAFTDITLSHNMEKLLSWQQTHDSLTELMNRREFENHLKTALNNALLSQQSSYFLSIDLNDFKIINDTCGHMAGDKLLVEITRMLSEIIQEPNVLARLGGDEFGILLDKQDEDQAIAITDKLLDAIDSHVFHWNKDNYHISASIGIVPVNASCENISCLLSAAEIACHAAKESRSEGSHYSIYSSANANLLEQMHELNWASKLTRALQLEEFELYAQKIVPLEPSTIDSNYYEILIRLNDGDKVLDPGSFIPAAEKYNLMPRIDRWVIKQTLKTLYHWSKKSGQADNIIVSINLSGASLSDEKISMYIQQIFEEFPFPAHQISFEVTETATIKHLGKASLLIDRIKEMGCKFSLDDFGSGLSSFSYLRQLPVDYLKIDGHFVKDVHIDDICYAMVDTINQIGKIMNIKTVAEYTENEEIIEKLKQINVDFIQGYAIGRPRKFSEILDELK
jgi:diguanylate cyclase (GGDEF)-like protein/PAS domain S-box-containing protein